MLGTKEVAARLKIEARHLRVVLRSLLPTAIITPVGSLGGGSDYRPLTSNLALGTILLPSLPHSF
jgi:hypothetical protein